MPRNRHVRFCRRAGGGNSPRLAGDLDEAVPDHSALSKARRRFGLAIFERFFERVVELCREAGLVWGEELFFDATRIRANADLDKMVPRFYWKAKRHLAELFAEFPFALLARSE